MSAPMPVRANTLWSDAVAQLNLNEPALLSTRPALSQRRRRGYNDDMADSRASVELLRDDDGLLRWTYHAPSLSHSSSKRSYRAYSLRPERVVERFRFNELGRNEVTQKLIELDDWLTPGKGMKRWQGGALIDDAQPSITAGRVLLLVHGTFSESLMFFKELAATLEGQALLKEWQAKYATILAFNHPTLSVGAWSNAIDLARALRAVTAPIDVVCHSRGGLVVSWLLRLVPVPIERVVFVASPLVGTSLAAPDKLRAALDLLANYAEVTAAISTAAAPAVPLAGAVAGLAKILGKTLRLGSGLPIVDAAIGLVPGLATQQLVGNNLDIQQLFADEWLRKPSMSAIGVSFRPDESREPLWKFWRRFSNLADQAKFAAADLVFPGANDLVVDVNSMFRLGEKQGIDFKDLGESPTTHHTSYFRDAKVLAHLQLKLA